MSLEELIVAHEQEVNKIYEAAKVINSIAYKEEHKNSVKDIYELVFAKHLFILRYYLNQTDLSSGLIKVISQIYESTIEKMQSLGLATLKQNLENHLVEAIKAGDLEYLEIALVQGANPNPQNFYATPPLIIAIQNGHLDLVKRLLQVRTLDINKCASLYELIALNYEEKTMELVNLLIEKGANVNLGPVNYVTEQLDSPLLRAIKTKQTNMVKLLIANKNININLMRPLSAAIDTNQPEILELLLAAGAIIRFEDLMLTYDKQSSNLFLTLFNHIENPTIKLYFCNNLLIYAARKSDNPMNEMLMTLPGVNVNFVGDERKTALGTAINYGNFNFAQRLIEHGAIINTNKVDKYSSDELEVSDNFFAFLHLAVKSKNMLVFTTLMKVINVLYQRHGFLTQLSEIKESASMPEMLEMLNDTEALHKEKTHPLPIKTNLNSHIYIIQAVLEETKNTEQSKYGNELVSFLSKEVETFFQIPPRLRKETAQTFASNCLQKLNAAQQKLIPQQQGIMYSVKSMVEAGYSFYSGKKSYSEAINYAVHNLEEDFKQINSACAV